LTDDMSEANALAAQFAGEDVPLTMVVLIRHAASEAGNIASFRSSSAGNPALQLQISDSDVLGFFKRDDGGSSSLMTFSTVTVGLWHIVGVLHTGVETIICIDGGCSSATAQNLGEVTVNTFVVGAKRSTSAGDYFDGTIAHVLIDDAAWSTNKMKSVTCEIAQEMWDERSIPFLSAAAACPDLTFE
jgi:hypothetical protein